MLMLFPGFSGLATGVGVFFLVWLIVWFRTTGEWFNFDAQGEKGAFEKILPIYLRAAEFIIGLASGSIVLLIGSSAFRAGGRLPWYFASPLFLLALCVLYGILFMVLLVWDYETYRHDPESSSYTRGKYARNQSLGFSALVCFCFGYVWLITIITRQF